MFRLLGFMLGSAVSIGAILLLLGIPEFHLSNPELDKGRFDEAVEKLKEKKKDVEVVARQVAEEVVETVDELQAAAETAPQPEPIAADIVDPPTQPPPLPAETTSPPIGDDPRWHTFWNPFRSEIAATGFVSQLERVTGLDYRVVKIEPGVYQVAFAYQDDAERLTKLSQISAATGLELPGS